MTITSSSKITIPQSLIDRFSNGFPPSSSTDVIDMNTHVKINLNNKNLNYISKLFSSLLSSFLNDNPFANMNSSENKPTEESKDLPNNKEEKIEKSTEESREEIKKNLLIAEKLVKINNIISEIKNDLKENNKDYISEKINNCKNLIESIEKMGLNNSQEKYLRKFIIELSGFEEMENQQDQKTPNSSRSS